ncbi:hypothetical protein H310_02477 [Aphanomyces invadans]|uniref:Uncharacterized protein n=1 Tax=Aphanomyces invadans TaxID=157072 RepID=A0A024UQK4_9STRA|nr:hypothetical protein H310_02477 [Aphanomyces invadans]ETW08137.1 hypothetical protein H310_02477 [Aphanomyces invadans]|eukprot:XP_008864230.1 hypothetical protein H310_02477 [Aphanomyces invadans]
MQEAAIGFTVCRATGSSFEHPLANLTQYNRKSYWASFAKQTEVMVARLDTKALLGEIVILNKSAQTVDISLAVQDKRSEYIAVKSGVRLPLNREFRIKLGYLPACFIRLSFKRQDNSPSIEVYAIQPRGISCGYLEHNGGPALFNVISHTTESILFGPSLPSSLPERDCLSETRSGSPAWMKRHQSLQDLHVARLENSLRSYMPHAPTRRALSYMY